MLEQLELLGAVLTKAEGEATVDLDLEKDKEPKKQKKVLQAAVQEAVGVMVQEAEVLDAVELTLQVNDTAELTVESVAVQLCMMQVSEPAGLTV
ncbi:hypothetical protein SRHO_G00109420 [Serrasalmus rhombeus]